MNATTVTPEPKSFGEEADRFLAHYYDCYNAETTEQKIALLERELGQGPSNHFVYVGSINEEMKLGCLEYDFLEIKGKLTLVLA